MKKIKKISILLLAMGTLVGVAACDSKAQTPATDNTSNNTNEGNDKTPTDGGEITPSTSGDTTPSTGGDSGEAGGTEQTITKYKVTFNTNGGSSINDQNIESGKTISSVSTTKEGCTFAGWYTDSSLTKSFNVTTPIIAATTLYAKWNVTITFNTNSGTAITSQTIASGEAISTVSTSRSGYDFAGWYTDSELKNVFDVTTPITKSLTLYAKWALKTTPGDIINDSNAYNEGAFVSFDLPANSTTKNATVSYSADGTSWTNIDSELISYDFTAKIAKAYILGLKAGSYVIKVNNGEKVSTTKTLYVSADDRSGYAHFNNTNGVGAYNNDGTLKDNAVVVYVSDANKNTVKATVNGSVKTGLVNIIKAATNSNQALDVRILDDIKTCQFNKKTYSSAAKTTDLLAEQAASIGGNYKSYTAAEIIEKGWNSYSDDLAAGITELNGLTSGMSYGGNSHNKNVYADAFDTSWNMLKVSGGKNITIEGVGENAGIFQWGFTFTSSSTNIEIKNLRFHNYTEDAIGIEGGGSNFWLHNNTFDIGVNNWDFSDEKDKGDGDGSTDFKKATNLTISYCRYNHTHKTNLIGGSNSDEQSNITLHHNYYNNCSSRLPLLRQANTHMYNNYYSGISSTGISVRATAYAFIENNYFDGKNPFMLAYKTSSSVDPIGTTIKAIGNEFSANTTACKLSENADQGIAYMQNGIYVLNAKDTASYDAVTVNTNATRTTKSTGSICTNSGVDYTNFDTNSNLFYYKDNKSNVDILNQASELPTLIPTVAGAGILPNFNLGSFTDIDTSTSGSESGSGSTDTPTKYTVTFETNGGTAITSQEVTSGNTISTVSTSKDNYTFAGWYTDQLLTTSFDVTTPITGPITLYAKWEATSSSSESQTGNTLTLVIPSTTGEKTESFAAGDFTVNATSDKKVKIYSDYIALNGGGSTTYRSIVANVGTTNEITITIKITGGSNDRYLVVADEAGNSLSETLVTGETLTIKASGSTKYYLYSKANGLNVYTLTITY